MHFVHLRAPKVEKRIRSFFARPWHITHNREGSEARTQQSISLGPFPIGTQKM
jgi:hypothetical protein